MTEAEKALFRLNEFGYQDERDSAEVKFGGVGYIDAANFISDHYHALRESLKRAAEGDKSPMPEMHSGLAVCSELYEHLAGEHEALKDKVQGLVKALHGIACSNEIWERDDMIDCAVNALAAFNSHDVKP